MISISKITGKKERKDMSVQVPKDKGLDRTLGIFKDGYEFISKRVQNHHLDVYETRLLGQKVALLSGEEGAKVFYDSNRMKRNGAMPTPVLKTLFGEGGVQTMDGKAHVERKHLFMSIMTPEALRDLHAITTNHWEAYAQTWEKKRKVVLFDEVLELLLRTACDWTGVPLGQKEIKKRADDMNKMIEGASKVGPRHVEGRSARKRSEQWIESVIQKVRNGEIIVPQDSTLYTVATHQEDGELLNARIAAVELLNVIRPLVAISRYIVFGAVAFQEFPETKDQVMQSEDHLLRFTQEVRRYFPFFPFLGALVKDDFTWQQYPFQKDQLVLLDLYGTNHDPRLWDNPEQFNPDRFQDWKGGLFDLIPQGGGDYHTGHRCPGEWPTIEVLKASFTFLSAHLKYQVPKQDYSYSLRKIPALPKSGFIMKKVQMTKK